MKVFIVAARKSGLANILGPSELLLELAKTRIEAGQPARGNWD